MSVFWNDLEFLKVHLNNLQKYLENVINLPSKNVNNSVTNLVKGNGKFVRAGLFYLFSEYGLQKDDERLMHGAASIELLHLATLIHDDVIDESNKRRGVETVQVRNGNRNAIYAGDYLFTLAFEETLTSALDKSDIQLMNQSMRLILKGELYQYDDNYNLNETVDEYLRIIEGKTACLFALACRQGARLAKADEVIIDLAEQIGRSIGLSYQIIDDILDYSGDSEKTNKPVLEDINEGVYSLPLLFALETNRLELEPILTKGKRLALDDLNNLKKIIIKSDSLDRARTVANELIDQANLDINMLPDGEIKDCLRKLLNKLLKRDK